MAKKVNIKKQTNLTDNDLEDCTKEELIDHVKSLLAYNAQLKNIITKPTDNKCIEHKNKKIFDFDKYNSRHILLKVLYLGWNYQGYVTQEDTKNTVEYQLFEALMKTKLIKNRQSSNYHRCGRTDKGVSAFGQTISIDVRSNLKLDDQNNIEREINYCKVLNRVLPDNIQCVAWASVNESFSARFNCEGRTYKYFFPKGTLNIESMIFASKKLLGRHDFRNLCKMDVGNGVVEFVRDITHIDIKPVDSTDSKNEYTLYVILIKGTAFLWHQIRCILGILLLIGQKKENPSVIDELLNIEKNPRRPEYSMASEIPLNLFFSEYDNVTWHYDKSSLKQVIEKINNIWIYTAIKQSMVKEMLDDLNGKYESVGDTAQNDKKCLSEHLLQGASPKNYIPVMKRQMCNSLEEKIKHFTKRKRIEVAGDKS